VSSVVNRFPGLSLPLSRTKYLLILYSRFSQHSLVLCFSSASSSLRSLRPLRLAKGSKISIVQNRTTILRSVFIKMFWFKIFSDFSPCYSVTSVVIRVYGFDLCFSQRPLVLILTWHKSPISCHILPSR
jgi:hypothetical protein